MNLKEYCYAINLVLLIDCGLWLEYQLLLRIANIIWRYKIQYSLYFLKIENEKEIVSYYIEVLQD